MSASTGAPAGMTPAGGVSSLTGELRPRGRYADRMDAPTHFTAVASTGDEPGWLLVHVPEIDQYTQARTLDEVGPMAADLIATWLNVPVESVDVEVKYTD